ncbi:ATP-binding cassette domain-containing protein [Candidatus Zixiibacteriota bacterium]
MSEVILELNNLSRTVTDFEQTKTIISDISYNFTTQKIYTVIGPSGAGKSSLLRLINRLDEPTSGEIKFRDKNHIDIYPTELRKKIGYLFQTPYLFNGTVLENLVYAKPDLNNKDIDRLINQVHIKSEFLNRSVDKLSVGEKQRVAFARLLALEPEIILLDEPTSALDPTYTQAIENLVKEIVSEQKVTAIVITHHPQQALKLGEESLLLVKGRLVESGISEQIINNPQSEEGKQYKAMELK